ncbi:MAG: alpha/beta fold hydrolase, partial [Xanthomonadales bacterium]|nr:alpha/beta fold hydrolase [Xanthomonadales bacterium]
MTAGDKTILVVDQDPVLAEHLKELIEFMDSPSVVTAEPSDWKQRLGQRRLEALFVGPDLAPEDLTVLLSDLRSVDPNVPVVMIHGWPESSYCWEHTGRHLKEGLRVIAPDLRGLGDSERTEGQQHYMKQALAEDVVSMLDELGIGEFQLVGHDWGGIVAQEVALAIPGRIQKMVIMNIAIINNLKGNMEV